MFNTEKGLNAHRFDIHKIIVHERKGTESMKRTQYVRTVNSYANIFAALFGIVVHCRCRRVFFSFCVTLPLIDHIFTFSAILPHFAVLIQCCCFTFSCMDLSLHSYSVCNEKCFGRQNRTKKNAILKMTTTKTTTNR